MSLDDLARLLPPPTHPVEAPDPRAWPLVERILGTALPPDYRAFLERHGTGRIEGALRVLSPFADDPEAQLGRQLLVRVGELAAATGGFGVPAPFAAPPEGWLLWARAENGAALYLRTIGAPEAWTVAVGAAGEACASWQAFPLSTTAFLAAWLSGALRCERLPAPPASPRFVPGASLRADVPLGWGGPIGALASSADGRTLALGHGARVSIVEAASLRELLRLDGHEDTVRSAAFGAAEIVTGSAEGSVQRWDLATGRPVGARLSLGAPIDALALGASALVVVAGSAVERHPLAPGGAVTRFAARGDDAVALSEDGALLARSDGARIEIWDVAAGKSRSTLARPKVGVLAFSTDGALLAAGDQGGVVTLWNVGSGASTATVKAHEQPVSALRFRRDGKVLASGGRDKLVRVVDVVSGKATGALSGHGEGVARLAFAGAALVSTTAPTNEILVWDLGRSAASRRPARPLREITALLASADGGQLFVGASDGTVHACALDGERAVQRLTPGRFGGTALALSPDGRSLAVAAGEQVLLIELATGETRCALGEHESWAQSAVFTRGGEALLVAVMDGSVRSYDTRSGEPGQRWEQPALEGFAMALSPDGASVAYPTEDGAVAVAALGASAPSRVFAGEDGADFLAFDAAGTRLAASSGGQVRVWDLASGEERASFTVPVLAASGDAADPRLTLAFAPGGALLVGRRDGAVALHAADGALLATLHLAAEEAAGFALDPQGRVDLHGAPDLARALPIARVGAGCRPFSACEERLRRPGLIRAALART
jgi:WD40 repeat protein